MSARRISKWTLFWLLWIGLFFGIEIPALRNKVVGDTFSEHVWRWAAVKSQTAAFKRLRRLALLVFVTWLSVHFLTGGRWV